MDEGENTHKYTKNIISSSLKILVQALKLDKEEFKKCKWHMK